jgi:hypothetical protein
MSRITLNMRPLLVVCIAAALTMPCASVSAQALATQAIPAATLPQINPGAMSSTQAALDRTRDQRAALVAQAAQSANVTQPPANQAPVTQPAVTPAPLNQPGATPVLPTLVVPATATTTTTTTTTLPAAPVAGTPTGSPVVPVIVPSQTPLSPAQPVTATPPVADLPSLVPAAPSAVTNEDLQQIRQQMLANMPGLSVSAEEPVIEEGYDPSLMRQLHQIGLDDDPVLRRAFKMEEDPEAMVGSIGAQLTHVNVDEARNKVLGARLGLYRTIEDFRAFLMESELKKISSLEGLMTTAPADAASAGPVAPGQAQAAPAPAPVEMVEIVIPDPQVIAIYRHEDESLAKVLWMDKTWTVREGDLLPNGSTVESIGSRDIEVRPKDEKKTKTLSLIAG